jgi:hypothetical protein
MEVHQISDVEDDTIIRYLYNYTQTGSLPESIRGEVEYKGNVIKYTRFDLYQDNDEDKNRNYSVKKSQVRASKKEIKREFKLRDL